MDRIDIQLWIKAVDAGKLVAGNKRAESSAAVAERVRRAREVQQGRFERENIFTNAEMNSRQMNIYCPLSDECKDLLGKLIAKMGLSARAYTRVIKLSRTIADLEGAKEISPLHLMEAANYRFLDKSSLRV